MIGYIGETPSIRELMGQESYCYDGCSQCLEPW